MRKTNRPLPLRKKVSDTFSRKRCLTPFLLLLVGCSPTVRLPRLLHPGPAGYQRYNAEEFDPYPAVDMGPEIVGGRPIDYMQPRSEVEQARKQLPLGPWRAPPSTAPRY